jgi:hypothetical protein
MDLNVQTFRTVQTGSSSETVPPPERKVLVSKWGTSSGVPVREKIMAKDELHSRCNSRNVSDL